MHEENERRCEAEALVHQKKRGGGASQQDMQRSQDTSKILLQLAEQISTTRIGRIRTKIQSTSHRSQSGLYHG